VARRTLTNANIDSANGNALANTHGDCQTNPHANVASAANANGHGGCARDGSGYGCTNAVTARMENANLDKR
jgi:hypothetical protein